MICNFTNFQMSYEKKNSSIIAANRLTETAATREICEVNGKDVVSERNERHWFESLNHRDIRLVDKPLSERLSVVNDEALCAAVDVDSISSIRKLSVFHGPSIDTMNQHWHKLGLVLKSPRQEPHELTDAQAQKK